MGDKIDKLKAELTRLDVEYDFTDRLYEVPSYQSVTWWYNTADKATFREYHDGSTQLIVHSSKHGITPEEAIAATLGPRECHETMINRYWRGCSECGYVWENMYAAGFQIGPNYCPMCGKKVVSDD